MAKLEKLLTQVTEHLDPGESILSAVEGSYEVERFGADSVRNGTLVATESRLLFFAKKMTGFDLESFPFKTISSFERGKNLMGGTLKFHASGNSVSVKWIQSKNLDEFVALVKERIDKSHETAPPAQSGRGGDPMEQLRKLAELKDAGVLTEDEFAAKKQALLDRI